MPPVIAKLCTIFPLPPLGTVYRYINVLIEKGVLDRTKKASRSLTLLQESISKINSSELSLPFIGYISAGEPLTTFSKSLSFQVPRSLVESPEATYVLKVRGESLTEELISDGDYLVVEARQEAYTGEIIVAMLNQRDMIVRKCFIEDTYIRLVSHNHHNQPLIVSEDDLLIQGIVVAVIRKLVHTSSSSSSGAGS